uniref:Ribosomal RNA-processing protein 44 n=1 Tax=Arcella intermedia TaxID=1963864 RepID=A0A6B2KXC0_9EUKA
MTNKKKVIKDTIEHYLRDDIGCGSPLCEVCKQSDSLPLGAFGGVYVIPDTNVLLYQTDWLYSPKVKDIILCQSALKSVRDKSDYLYYRLRELSSEDDKRIYVFSNEHHRKTYVPHEPHLTEEERDFKAISSAAKWYSEHLTNATQVYLLTNNLETKALAVREGIPTKTVHEFVRESGDFELIDLLAGSDSTSENDSESVPPGEIEHFCKHLSAEERKVFPSKLHEGTLRPDLDNYDQAFFVTDSLDKEILIIGKTNRNRALAGDRVYVELLPESEWKSHENVFKDADMPRNEKGEVVYNQKGELVPTGRVVAICRRTAFRKYCGTIDPNSIPAKIDTNADNVVLFDAIDSRLPKVALKLRQPEKFKNQRIVVQLDSWPRYSQHPQGHFVKLLGPVGDPKTEAEALLIQHGISYEPFSQAVMACLPNGTWRIKEEDLLRRVDLRESKKVRVVSIDPPGCTDIDDALHLRIKKNGNFEVGVHIADVSHFVLENTALDREAAKRGNTVYLVDRRIDMLPGELSTNICSLKPREDRFSFSVTWEIDSQAQILKTKFFKSIIRSKEAFTYGEAQARIDNKALNDEITQDLRNLLHVSKILRKRRMEVGALSLSSPQVKFKKDEENKEPVDVELYEMKETNSLVEEFMLLANVAVAKEILKFFPAYSLLRRHPPPKMKQFAALVDLVQNMGLNLKVDSSKSLSESLDKATRAGDPFFNELLRILTTRCMTQALYFSSGTLPQSQFYHYGLAAPIYTHFTSPIRRYADVVVHRLLAAAIGYDPLPQALNKNQVQKVCNGINQRGRMADIAARDSTRLYTMFFFKKKILNEVARVIQIRSNGFSIMVPRYGIEGKVYLNEATENSKPWVYDAEHKILQSQDGKHKIQIFDIITVQISLDESISYAPRVVYKCVEPPLHKGLTPTHVSNLVDPVKISDAFHEELRAREEIKNADEESKKRKEKPKTPQSTRNKKRKL